MRAGCKYFMFYNVLRTIFVWFYVIFVKFILVWFQFYTVMLVFILISVNKNELSKNSSIR